MCLHSDPIPAVSGSLRKEKAVGSNLNRFFSRMGARVRVMETAAIPVRGRWNSARSTEQPPQIVIDIRRDKLGEFFEIRTAPRSRQEIDVLNVQPQEKHLVLLSRQFDMQGSLLAKQKFLCGRDEKHWFVAAIPENEPVSTVAGARLALKPEEVRVREQVLGVSRKESFRRKKAAYVRQGEWFFVPEMDVSADSLHILLNEPLSRGNGSKAHWVEQCYRTGGQTVYISGKYPSGISAEEYNRLPESERKLGFTMMKRDVVVYVRGEVRHPDHQTITLDGWHRVFMNTENRSIALRYLAFLD
jgi:hypothetical protein